MAAVPLREGNFTRAETAGDISGGTPRSSRRRDGDRSPRARYHHFSVARLVSPGKINGLGVNGMSKSCKGMLEEMLKCVEETDCVKKGNSLKACVKDGRLFPSECQTKREVYLSCKRGQFDMRSRLRGNKGY